MKNEKDIIKIVTAEEVDETIEKILKTYPESKGWLAKEPRVESVAGGKVKIILHFSKQS